MEVFILHILKLNIIAAVVNFTGKSACDSV